MRTCDAEEHLCLMRHLGGLQTRVSAQMQALAASEAHARARAEAAERACAALEAALMRERARWVLTCTRASWGLGSAPMLSFAAADAEAAQSASSHADMAAPSTVTDVLCQTGCQGHAHPWLTADGGCRLTGADCTRVQPAAHADTSDDLTDA